MRTAKQPRSAVGVAEIAPILVLDLCPDGGRVDDDGRRVGEEEAQSLLGYLECLAGAIAGADSGVAEVTNGAADSSCRSHC